MDIFTREKRSEIMAKVSSKDTKPEIIVRKFLFSRGFRFRKNVKNLPGKPDIVLRKYKTIIFINGCFWHGHTCKRAGLPKNNHSFWEEKIAKNKTRDIENIRILEEMGWHVITVWQCELLNVTKRENKLGEIVNILHYFNNE